MAPTSVVVSTEVLPISPLPPVLNLRVSPDSSLTEYLTAFVAPVVVLTVCPMFSCPPYLRLGAPVTPMIHLQELGLVELVV